MAHAQMPMMKNRAKPWVRLRRPQSIAHIAAIAAKAAAINS